ncbi:MAG TPA: hypothetical protein VNP93_08245 [Gaiellaceae bacterium]|nr:hypothetical protein [Gaiellaceae bacterium]
MDVLVRVDAGLGADDEETAALVARLREELVAVELDPVAAPAETPPGAKGLGAGELGSMLVVLAASGGVLTTLVGTVQAWLLRHADSRIVLEVAGDRLELTGATDSERRRALDNWLARHDAGRAEKHGGDTAS